MTTVDLGGTRRYLSAMGGPVIAMAVAWVIPIPVVIKLAVSAGALGVVVTFMMRSPWKVLLVDGRLVVTFLVPSRKDWSFDSPEVLRTDSGRLLVKLDLPWDRLVGPTVLSGPPLQRVGPQRRSDQVEPQLVEHGIRIKNVPEEEWWAW